MSKLSGHPKHVKRNLKIGTVDGKPLRVIEEGG